MKQKIPLSWSNLNAPLLHSGLYPKKNVTIGRMNFLDDYNMNIVETLQAMTLRGPLSVGHGWYWEVRLQCVYF